ncbi:MAG: type II toxin-antitoxin system RelE/ParE family toxin [Coriobacteriia bacterium]|nr:type II toxin-antitoxin system RelE/ParE family toxin [Coriobacteriia bacterium]
MTKPLVWLRDEIATPPFSRAARVRAGVLLRSLQDGEVLALPHSRPMPVIGARCHELRVSDGDVAWRIVYRADSDAIVIAAVFRKTTRATPPAVIDECKRRLSRYDAASRRED